MGNRWKRRWRFALRVERRRPARSAAADFDEHDSYSGVMFANDPKGRMMQDAAIGRMWRLRVANGAQRKSW